MNDNELYKSKQITGASQRAPKQEDQITALEKVQKEIRTSIQETNAEETKLSNNLLRVLDSGRTALPESEHNVPIANRNTLEVVGKQANGPSYGRIMKKQLEEFVQSVTMYTHTGVYHKIVEARINSFLAKELPILKQSLSLFVDDVNNGSYRGNTFLDSRYVFYENGTKITDDARIRKMNQILNPTEYYGLVTEYQSCDDIDSHGDFLARQHGNSSTRIISHKQVAKDLYIKYILKENKKKTGKVMRVKDQKTATESFVLESVDGSKRTIDTYEAEEYLREESFLQFVERFAGSRLHRAYMESEDSMSAVCFEMDGLTQDSKIAIADSITRCSYQFPMGIGTESCSLVNQNVHTRMTDPEKKLLAETSFQDIYNTSLTGIYNHVGMGLESTDSVHLPHSIIGTPLEQVMHRVSVMINDPNLESQLGLESLPTLESYFDNTLEPSHGKMIIGADGTSTPEEEIKEENINYGRLERMFRGVKGESIEFLDNTRKIPIVVGYRHIGDLYIEYTHQDLEHLVGLRTIMGSPASYIQNINTVNTRTEEQEETLGRLAFGDIIKPLIEKNIDTKFIKENSGILYTIQKLIEENELSNQTQNIDTMQNNMYNMSRVIFIPANEIIFKRCGKGPMGESKFAEAMVPATCAILANESYLSWILCDGKGMSFIMAPRGMSEVSSENGVQPLEDRIQQLTMTRSDLRDSIYADSPLTHKIILMYKDDMAQNDIDIKTLQLPEFEIDKDQIREWVQQATDIVGYNSALFTSMDGNVELARKLFEMNDTKVISILEEQKAKRKPASILATRLLRIRGGESYDNITVEWIPPSVDKGNTVKLHEIVDDIKEAFESYVQILETLYANNEEFELVKEEILKDILQKLSKGDQIISSIDSIYESAKNRVAYNVIPDIKESSTTEEENEPEE